VGAGVLLILTVGGWFGYSTLVKQPPEPIAVPTIPVEKGDIEITITESGAIELGGQQTFKAPSDITVQEVRVQERQRVKAGTVLLVLRDRQLQQALNDRLVENQKAQNTLTRKREIVQEQQEKLKTAQERFADAESLYERGFISEDEYLSDKEQVDIALSGLKDAQVELMNAELDARNAQLTIQNLRTQLADNQIVTPIDAVVLKVEVKPGDGVQQEGRLLTIGDPIKETVRLQLTTLNAAKVKVNMPVRVSMIGPNPQVFTGRISRVSPQALSEDGGGFPREDAAQSAKVEAEAILNRPSGVLIPGSAVSVEIILDQRRNVMIVPLTAIQNDGESQFVWVKDREGRAQKREVTVGLQNIQSAEIISGLQVGDAIVTALPSEVELTPGAVLTDPAEIPLENEFPSDIPQAAP
jgi:HlyD family secretion protein